MWCAATFQHVVQGEFARLDAELEGIRATTLKALQERPAHYTNALSSRVKELQAKAEEVSSGQGRRLFAKIC
mgnify:CR=1 FL=1